MSDAFDQDHVSVTLGKAWGLACMCEGLLSEPTEDELTSSTVRGIKLALQHIAALAADAEEAAEGAPASVREAIAAARGACEVVAADAIITIKLEDDRELNKVHWNEEATGWALFALSDALSVAKDAVDDRDSQPAADPSPGIGNRKLCLAHSA